MLYNFHLIVQLFNSFNFSFNTIPSSSDLLTILEEHDMTLHYVCCSAEQALKPLLSLLDCNVKLDTLLSGALSNACVCSSHFLGR